MKKIDNKLPPIHHASLLLAILFIILLAIVKFSNVYLFFLAVISSFIAYKTKPKEYTLKSYLTFGEDNVFVASKKMINLVASPVTDYLPGMRSGRHDELELLDVDTFLDDLGVGSSIEGKTSNKINELFGSQIERINKDRKFYRDSKFEEDLANIVAYDAIKAQKLECKIKSLSTFVSSKIDELYKNKEYSVLTRSEKQKLKDEIFDDIKTRDDLPGNIKSNVEYFAQEYYSLSDEKINKICNFIREIGPLNLKTIKECFLSRRGEVLRVHHLHKGDYRYNEIIELEKSGILSRVNSISFEELLTLLHIDELEQIASANDLKPAVGRDALVEQLLELPLSQSEIEEHLASKDFFAISDNYYRNRLLLGDSIKYLAALSSTEEFLSREFRIYVDSLFGSNKKSA